MRDTLHTDITEAPGEHAQSAMAQTKARGYSICRTAEWIKGKPGNSSLGKLLRCTGATALAGFAINVLENATTQPQPVPPPQPDVSDAGKQEKTPTPKAVAEKPVVTKKTRSPATKETPRAESILSGTPEHQNLVDWKELYFKLDGKEHWIKFKNDGLYLDGVRYAFLAGASFASVNVSVKDVRRTGNTLAIHGAVFEGTKTEISGTITQTDLQLEDILRSLLRGQPFERTIKGVPMWLERQKY